MPLTVGVLALQGAFLEHLTLLRRAAATLSSQPQRDEAKDKDTRFIFMEVRNTAELLLCDALIIPGGESTTISLVAARSDLLEALRNFVK